MRQGSPLTLARRTLSSKNCFGLVKHPVGYCVTYLFQMLINFFHLDVNKTCFTFVNLFLCFLIATINASERYNYDKTCLKSGLLKLPGHNRDCIARLATKQQV